jgi:hypothetical protein
LTLLLTKGAPVGRSPLARPAVLLCLLLTGVAAVAMRSGAAQPADEPRSARFARMSRDAEAKGLADPFKGVTADGTVAPNLFAITSTGVSTAPVQKAAAAFIATLSADQRTRTLYGVDDPEWRKWMNQHFYARQGLGFGEMTDAQREAAFGLLRASLSARGLTLSRDIMKLNTTLAELNKDDFEQYGEGRYYLTVMGTPSLTQPWGWQIDGHHLIVNYFVLGDQVVMTPSFFGSEPVVATTGKYAGTKILQDEQAAGLALVNGLDDGQRAKAILRADKPGNDNVGEAWKDNVVVPYAGLPVSAFTPAQRTKLLDLVALHIDNMDEGHAKLKMAEIRNHLDATWFAWMGGTGPDSVFYYRIHSPVVLIEFDHQLPVGVRHLVANPRVPFRNHIHVVVRTPNGNDYGKDLLRQHYAAQRGNAAHGHGAPWLVGGLTVPSSNAW